MKKQPWRGVHVLTIDLLRGDGEPCIIWLPKLSGPNCRWLRWLRRNTLTCHPVNLTTAMLWVAVQCTYYVSLSPPRQQWSSFASWGAENFNNQGVPNSKCISDLVFVVVCFGSLKSRPCFKILDHLTLVICEENARFTHSEKGPKNAKYIGQNTTF